MKKILLLFVAALFIGCTQPAKPDSDETVVSEVKVVRSEDVYHAGEILGMVLDPGAETLAVLSTDMLKDTEVKPGDILAVSHAGIFLESYPVQFGSAQKVEKVREESDQVGLVTDAYDALIEADPALLADTDKLGLDLSRATTLTEIEKRAVLWHIENAGERQILEGTFEELAEQGYIDEEALVWEDGALFSFAVTQSNDEKTEVVYDTRLWRSDTGVIGEEGVTAVWEEDNWTRSGGRAFTGHR